LPLHQQCFHTAVHGKRRHCAHLIRGIKQDALELFLPKNGIIAGAGMASPTCCRGRRNASPNAGTMAPIMCKPPASSCNRFIRIGIHEMTRDLATAATGASPSTQQACARR
jgi:hypothetical protein